MFATNPDPIKIVDGIGPADGLLLDRETKQPALDVQPLLRLTFTLIKSPDIAPEALLLALTESAFKTEDVSVGKGAGADVAGTVTLKMAPVLKRIWDQMPDPKYCISMGACSSVGGPFNTYSVLQGVDRIVPVDVYVTGCPPRPENLFYALLKLQDKINNTDNLVRRPTEVRLDEAMLENFKRQVMVAQIQKPV